MAATFACPDCGHKSSIKKEIPSGAKLRCPACNTSRRYITLTNVPWHKDPILKYAWIIPLVVLVPFFLFLSRHIAGNILGFLLDHIVVIGVLLVLLPIVVIAAIVLAVIVNNATNRENGFSTQTNGGLWASFFAYLGDLPALPVLVLLMVGQVSPGNSVDEKPSEFQTNYSSSTTRTPTERERNEAGARAVLREYGRRNLTEREIRQGAKDIVDEWDRVTKGR